MPRATGLKLTRPRAPLEAGGPSLPEALVAICMRHGAELAAGEIQTGAARQAHCNRPQLLRPAGTCRGAGHKKWGRHTGGTSSTGALLGSGGSGDAACSLEASPSAPLSTDRRPDSTHRITPRRSGMRAPAPWCTRRARCSSSRRVSHGSDLHASDHMA